MFDRLYPDNNYHIFDEDDFKKTHDFIEKYKDSHFVVHCDAGVSRSSATALAIAKELAPEDYQKLLNLGIYFPNVLIYSYLVEGKFNDKLYKKNIVSNYILGDYFKKNAAFSISRMRHFSYLICGLQCF